MQTAKTILLKDGSLNFISPATNIESLYYEKPGTDQNQNIIYRHQLSQHFPVYVNPGEDATTTGYKVAKVNKAIIDLSTKASRKDDEEGNDIILSNFILRRIAGTNYYAVDVSSYNLSAILLSYAGLSYVEKEVLNLSTYILVQYNATIRSVQDTLTTLNTNINNVSIYNSSLNASLNTLLMSITYDTIYRYDQLHNFKSNKVLIPGCNYVMDYKLSDTDNYYSHYFYMVLHAVDNHTFDANVISCIKSKEDTTYFNNSDLSKWEVKYDFDSNTIIYMKDEFGNEAPFDFKNKKLKGANIDKYYLFSYSDGGQLFDYSLCKRCANNVIKSDDKQSYFLFDSSAYEVKNNYIGYDNTKVVFDNCEDSVLNNIIGNNNKLISIESYGNGNIIGDGNNTITISKSSQNVIKADCSDVYIESSDNNEIYSECKSINIYGAGDSNMIYENCGSITINQSYNSVVHQNCSNIVINKNNATIAQYTLNLNVSTADIFYTYQTIYARGYKAR